MATKIVPALGAGILPDQEGPGAEPGYSALDVRRMVSAGVVQQGVRGAGSFLVKERGAGANMSVDVTMEDLAWVKGTTVTAQEFYTVPPHSATLNEVVAASNETNPRIDQVILRVYDNAIDSSGKNEAVIEVLKGTAEAGATLANHKGAAALPASSLRLAYVLVPAKATTIVAGDIEDVTSWAVGGVRASETEEQGRVKYAVGPHTIGSPGAMVERALATAFTPNASRPTYVQLTIQTQSVVNSRYAVKVGGVTVCEVDDHASLAESEPLTMRNVGLIVPAGETWEVVNLGEVGSKKLFSSYTTL